MIGYCDPAHPTIGIDPRVEPEARWSLDAEAPGQPVAQRRARGTDRQGVAARGSSIELLVGCQACHLTRGAEQLKEAGVSGDIEGGAVYDALIAVTAERHGATILTLDGRAARTYELCGVTFDLLTAA